jgi:hypothetical protein
MKNWIVVLSVIWLRVVWQQHTVLPESWLEISTAFPSIRSYTMYWLIIACILPPFEAWSWNCEYSRRIGESEKSRKKWQAILCGGRGEEHLFLVGSQDLSTCHSDKYRMNVKTWEWIEIEAWFRVRVTLRLAVYRPSVRLGAKPLETHDQRFLFSTEHLQL